MFIHAFCLHHVDGLATKTLKFGCVMFVLSVGSSGITDGRTALRGVGVAEVVPWQQWPILFIVQVVMQWRVCQ